MLEITESKEKLVWNTIYSDFNARRIRVYNVFGHYGFLVDCQKNAKKNKDNKEAFAEQLRKDLMYHFWSKCECEVIVSQWPPREDGAEEKIDIYDQVCLNWDIFLDYVWSHLKDLKPKKT